MCTHNRNVLKRLLHWHSWRTGIYRMDGLFRNMRSEGLRLMHARNGA